MFQGKVFGIGAHKTGTTSLRACFETLGLVPHASWDRSHRLVPHLIEGNLRTIRRFARSFRSFQDSPWCFSDFYRQLDDWFPGSRFILTLRDESRWFDSLRRMHTPPGATHSCVRDRSPSGVAHFKRQYGLLGHCLEDEEERVRRAYRARNDGILAYFAGRRDFIALDWERGDGWEQLCSFLEAELPDCPFPHANACNLAKASSPIPRASNSTRSSPIRDTGAAH